MVNSLKNNQSKLQKKCDELYSFDIFDTLVTRRTAIPTGIFAIMQSKLRGSKFSSLLQHNFYKIRIGSEELARQNKRILKKTPEVTLDDIYKVIQFNESLSDSEIVFLKKLELENEKCNVVVLSNNLLKLKELCKRGKRVVLISDMYLTSEQIHYIIDDLDPVFRDLKIYVSCEYGVAKHTGDLPHFLHV